MLSLALARRRRGRTAALLALERRVGDHRRLHEHVRHDLAECILHLFFFSPRFFQLQTERTDLSLGHPVGLDEVLHLGLEILEHLVLPRRGVAAAGVGFTVRLCLPCSAVETGADGRAAAATAASAGTAARSSTGVRSRRAVHLKPKDARHVRAAAQMRKLFRELHDQQVRESGAEKRAIQLVRRRVVSVDVEYFMASRAEQFDITLVWEVAPADGEELGVVAVDNGAATEIALPVFTEL